MVAAAGDYGKPRPAVVVQTDALPASYQSVVLCQMTSTVLDAERIRITIEPRETNGLRVRSQIMVDKPTTVERSRIGQVVGRLADDEIANLDLALAFVMGLADR